MKQFATLALAVALAVSMIGTATAKPASGPGKVTIGVDATEWSSDTVADPGAGIFPVGGAGQLQGEFVTAERLGIQVAVRATDRFDGLLEASGKKVGSYDAATGFDTGTSNRAEWNYDFHVDLRNAHGAAAGTTLSDYTLELEQDFSDDMGSPFDLTFGAPALDNAVLYQQSFNPVFFNGDFDVDAETTYSLRVVLTPATFNGPPIAAAIQVNVADA